MMRPTDEIAADLERACGCNYPDNAYGRLASDVPDLLAEVERLTTRAERAEAKANDFEGRYETAHASGMWAVDCFRRAEREAKDAKRHVERLTTENERLRNIVGGDGGLEDGLGITLDGLNIAIREVACERDALRVENERLTRLAQQHDDMAADYRDETLRLRDAVAKVQAMCNRLGLEALWPADVLAALAEAAPTEPTPPQHNPWDAHCAHTLVNRSPVNGPRCGICRPGAAPQPTPEPPPDHSWVTFEDSKGRKFDIDGNPRGPVETEGIQP